MAIYHLSLKNGKKGKAKQHADYISCEGKYEEKSDLRELIEMNIPEQTKNAKSFFAASDRYERKNGRSYRELEISLANELTHEQNKHALLDFIAKTQLRDKPMLIAIHAGKDGNQLHAHIMFSERANADFKMPAFFKRNGSKKDRLLNDKKYLFEMRETWEDSLNNELVAANQPSLVSCKSHAERGLNIKPQPKLGHAAQAMISKGKTSRIQQEIDKIMQENISLRELDEQSLALQLEMQRQNDLRVLEDIAALQRHELEPEEPEPELESKPEAEAEEEGMVMGMGMGSSSL